MNVSYYRLSAPYVLHSWNDGTNALKDNHSGRVGILSPHSFHVLKRCDGETPVSNELLTQQEQRLLESFQRQGIVERLNSPCPLSEKQNCRQFSNNAIFSAKWSITGRCNYQCRHCFLSAETKKTEMNTQWCKSVIDQMEECGVCSVALTGGEPLLRKDFVELLAYFCEKKIAINQIYTNGSLISRELLEFMKACHMQTEFCISYDGVGSHDWVRNKEGASREVEQGIKLCVEYGFPVSAELCLFHGNKDTLCQSIRYLTKIGVSKVTVSPVLRAGSWEMQPEEADISLEEAIDAYMDYIPCYFADDMPVDLSLSGVFIGMKKTKQYRVTGEKYRSDIDCKQVRVCEHARRQMYITAVGTILPCMALAGAHDIEKEFPNLREMDLKTILKDSSYLRCINITLEDYFSHNPECAACEHRFACGAGCRAAAVHETGDYYGSDKSKCTLLKKGYVQQIRSCVEKVRKMDVL